MGRPYKCPFCGACRSISKGVRKTKLLGVRRLRVCRACGRKFTPRHQKSVVSPVDQVPSETEVHAHADAGSAA